MPYIHSLKNCFYIKKHANPSTKKIYVVKKKTINPPPSPKKLKYTFFDLISTLTSSESSPPPTFLRGLDFPYFNRTRLLSYTNVEIMLGLLDIRYSR